MKAAFLLLAGALALGGCRKSEEKKEETAEAKPAAAQEKKRAPRPPPEPVDEGIDVPTEEDFEDAVSAQINEQTDLGKELDKLEKEIGK
ncbi:MAG TPA: hypothetical protein VNN80_05855 [Polyangiaceae bacterium]|jgi:PBP1b-binding outer membrane lipoprotein LpoB|nr:hypothetical protein [Polyangiaceae bacterium]